MRKLKPEFPIVFRVYPGRRNQRAKATDRKLFWVVMIHQDHRAMRETFRDELVSGHRFRGDDNSFGAIVMPTVTMKKARNGRWITKPSLGHCLFTKTQFSSEEITHESIHMSTGYLRRIAGEPTRQGKIDLGSECGEREEDVAYAAGNCARQIVAAARKARFFR